MTGEARPPLASGRELDVGVGDPEAPANAIPNIIAQLVETETWRNAATVLTGLLLIAMGYWAYHGIRQSIAETRVTGLEALLGTVVRGVDVWVGEHRTEAMRVSKEPEVVERAPNLSAAARSGADAAEICRSPNAVELGRLFRSLLGTQGVVAFLVLDRGGQVLASENSASCGQRMRSPIFRQGLDRTLDGTPQFVRPYPDLELSIAGASGERRPVAWFLVPIRDRGGTTTTALAIGVVADRDLVTVFTAARPGTTAETYAFSADGLMLTPSRFAEALASEGVVSASAADHPAFTVSVRDPGGDLAGGYVPKLEPGARPLTQAAALAVASRAKPLDSDRFGAVAEPYRGYRGGEVIGVWRWLPAYDMGVIAEISADEAFATLRYLWISFVAIGAFTVISLGAALTSSLTLSRLERQFGRLQRLGAYTLEREISEGGMATIYRARHALLKRPTAIKVLKKSVATDEFIHRFEREVQLASQLRHPNNVQIYDFGRTREGQPYYVMEYLEGMTLAQLVTLSGRVPPGRVIHILRQLAAALREAHLRGMIHRDVKPENVMICRRGEDDFVKLLDFGLVKNVDSAQTRDVTKQIKILGTPRYMSPERILNPADADARSDIYALGAVAYLLLTGKPIFDGTDNLAISNQVLHAPAPRASASGAVGIPDALDALVAACLDKDRTRRPQTADAVIEALDRLGSRLVWTQADATAWWTAHTAAATPNPPPAAAVVR